MPDRECPVCGGPELHYGFLAGEDRFDECGGCGLLSHQTARQAPAPATAARAGVPAGPDAPLPEAPDLLGLLARYLGPAARRLAVVGPPSAGLLAEASRLGFRVQRLDPTSPRGEAFDAVLVLNELENQIAPVGFVEQLRDHLAPGGAVAILTRQLVKAGWQTQGPALLGRRQRHSLSDLNLQTTLWKAGFRDAFVHHFSEGGRSRPSAFLEEQVLALGRMGPLRDRPVLSVVIPVFNEAATAGEILEAVAAKEIPGWDLEVVVVESNSTDGSRQIVEAFASRPRFRVVFEDRPRGKGHAVRTGLGHATGDVLLIQDADLEYDLLDYDMLVEPVLQGRTAFVLGTRHAGHWKIRRFARHRFADVLNVAHWALVYAMNRLYGQAMTDPFTMFKVFRRDALSGLTFECDRFDFDVELVCKLLRKGYDPQEIPVNYRARSFEEGKKVRMFRDPITWVRAMFAYRTAPVHAMPLPPPGPGTALEAAR